MPIYEFKCDICQERVARLYPVGSDGSKEICAACGRVGLSRVMSGFSSPGCGGEQNSCASCSGASCSSCRNTS